MTKTVTPKFPAPAHISRRGLLMAGGAAGLTALAGCSNGLSSTGGATIDARVDETLRYLYANYPDARDLQAKANGVLVMPLVTEAGFGIGGSFGRGALRVAGATVDYYSQAKASVGLQIGAQQYAHALFFMTEDSLGEFRYSPGWVAGADIKYAVLNEGDRFSADTFSEANPVVAMVFGTTGLLIGASIEGTKYTRIIP